MPTTPTMRGSKDQQATSMILDVTILSTLLEAIESAGEVGIPSGHLYAICMGHLSLETYTNLITILKHLGLVTESNYLLKGASNGNPVKPV